MIPALGAGGPGFKSRLSPVLNLHCMGETKKIEGTLGFEPRTYRSAVDCSTTELYPHACYRANTALTRVLVF